VVEDEQGDRPRVITMPEVVNVAGVIVSCGEGRVECAEEHEDQPSVWKQRRRRVRGSSR